jgi:hypothetical protein
MAISLIPNKGEKKIEISGLVVSILSNFYVALSLLILVVAVVAYIGLVFYSTDLEDELETLQLDITILENQIDRDLEKEMTAFAFRLDTIEYLLTNHTYSSRVFEFLEDITHPNVQFTNFQFDMKDNFVQLEGKTKNYLTLGEQIIVFQNDERISNFKIFNIKLSGKDGVFFSASFTLDKEIYVLN